MIYKYNSTSPITFVRNGQSYTYESGDIIRADQVDYVMANWSGRVLIVQDPGSSPAADVSGHYPPSTYWPSKADVVAYLNSQQPTVTSVQEALDNIFSNIGEFLSGLVGPTGMQGPTGPYGGPKGPTGPTGIGALGPTGAQGVIGLIGPTGRGNVGPTGPPGPPDGPQGPTGIQGKVGPTGLPGPRGPMGYSSIDVKKIPFDSAFGSQVVFTPNVDSTILKVVCIFDSVQQNDLPDIYLGTRATPNRDFDLANARLEQINMFIHEPYSDCGSNPFDVILSVYALNKFFSGNIYIWTTNCS
jgi:hypothetical protein